MKRALSVALLSSLALADITNSLQTVDTLLQKADNIDRIVQQQQDLTYVEEFLQKVASFEERLNQFVNSASFANATPEQIEEFLTKSEELAKKTEALTERITNLVNSADRVAPAYIHTLDKLLATTLRLSDDIGVMADRIGEMADRIVYTEELIGQMADRIVHTEHLITETATNMASMISEAQNRLSNISANSYTNSMDREMPTENMPQMNDMTAVTEGMPAGIEGIPQIPQTPQVPEVPSVPNMMDSMTPQQQEMMQNMMNQMMNR